MNPYKPDYTRVFSHLCHIAAINKDGKTDQCMDNLILNLFIIDESFAPHSYEEVIEAIIVYFDLHLGLTEVQNSLGRLLTIGSLTFDNTNNILKISLHAKADVSEKISKAAQLEIIVRDQWVSSLYIILENAPSTTKDKLWNALRIYMGKAFKRHGVETIQLLNNIHLDIDPELNTLSSYLEEAILELDGYLPANIAAECIRTFFKTVTPERTKYIAQLLDSTFSYFGLANDKETTEYLNQAISPLSLFLDTNFIFGILDLHVNPLVDVSKELLDVIKVNQLPFKLYYHEETLAEINRTIDSIGHRLKSQRWQQSISRAVIKNGQLGGVEQRYHEINAKTPLDPDIFLLKYEAITDLLDEFGFEIYRDPLLDDEREMSVKGELVAEYQHFMEIRRHRRPKPYAALNHDMGVWRTIYRMRRAGASVLNAGALFLTADFYLYAFDRQLLREDGGLGIVVLPNQFLQLLRPFIQSDEDFDLRFVETFAIPEFRTIGSDYSATISKVVSFLNTFKDIGEETASRILANSILIDHLRGTDEDSPDFKESIENALAQDNEYLIEEKEALIAEKKMAKQHITELEGKLKQSEETMEAVMERAQDSEIKERQAKQALENMDKILNAERESKKAISERLRKHQKAIRIISGGVVGLLGLILIISANYIISWPWLVSHPNQLGLLGSALIIDFGISWTIIDPKHLRYSLGVVTIGALLVLVKLLGR
jgi:hypothetical protein